LKYYPIFLDIKDRPVLVIGGGNIALEKVGNLLKAGAKITLISPTILPSIRRFNRRITFIEREFHADDISENYIIIFAATGESKLNASVSATCRSRRILCNTVDEPAFCHFIIPAIVRRGAITIAVSTSGVSPYMARLLKEKLRHFIGPEYTILSRLLTKYRSSVKRRFLTFQDRLAFWKTFFEIQPAEKIQNGNVKSVENFLSGDSISGN